MHDHREILALAAAAIDFELDPDERDRLDRALETCSLCRRQVAALRATSTVLRRPLDIGPPGRVRDVVIGAALQGGRRATGLRSVLAASLSILVILGGVAVVVGSRGLGIPPPPSPGPSAVAQASPASPGPSGTDHLGASPSVPVVDPSPGDDLLRSGDIVAMVTDERLVIRTQPETGPNSALFKTRLYPGQRALVLDGPVPGDGYAWYRIRLGVIEGWVAAADRDGTPWLARVGNGSIAVVREATDGSGEAIHTIDADGATGERVLLDDPALTRYAGLTWSPDGSRLAFVATPAGSVNGTSEVFTIEADGSNLVRISQDEVDDDSPAWSPDGTRLAFRVAGDRASTAAGSTVVVTPIHRPAITVLGAGANPAWSPDGQQLAMTVTDGAATHLWVQDSGGTGRRMVGGLEVAAVAPTWSPDGQTILVTTGGLSLIDVATGAVTALIADGSTSSPATWSARGTIAFVTTGSGSPGLFAIAPDGTGLTQVLSDQGFAAVAAWSPDGRWLLLADAHTGSPVTLVDAGTGRVVELDPAGGLMRSAAWQPLLP